MADVGRPPCKPARCLVGFFQVLKCAGVLPRRLGRRAFSVVLSSWARVRPIRFGFQARLPASDRSIKDKWTLDRLLGVGGMAAVYAATHRNNEASGDQDAPPGAQPRPRSPRSLPQGRLCLELGRAQGRGPCGRRRRHRGRPWPAPPNTCDRSKAENRRPPIVQQMTGQP